MTAEPIDEQQPLPDDEESKLAGPQPTRVLEMRMLAAKGEIGGEYDGSNMERFIAGQKYAGVIGSGIHEACLHELDDHDGLIETNDSRLWICPQ